MTTGSYQALRCCALFSQLVDSVVFHTSLRHWLSTATAVYCTALWSAQSIESPASVRPGLIQDHLGTCCAQLYSYISGHWSGQCNRKVATVGMTAAHLPVSPSQWLPCCQEGTHLCPRTAASGLPDQPPDFHTRMSLLPVAAVPGEALPFCAFWAL